MKKNEKKSLKNWQNLTKKNFSFKQKKLAKNLSEKVEDNTENIVKNSNKNLDKNRVKISQNLTQKNLDKTEYKINSIFINDEINLSNKKRKKEFLILLTNALYSLSHSNVYSGKLGLGGEYHKNYYNIIKKEFLKDKSEIFCLKNTSLKVFLTKIMLNLCNYGIYFYNKKNNETYIKICCGNGFVLSKNQQNYVEKFINEHIN